MRFLMVVIALLVLVPVLRSQEVPVSPSAPDEVDPSFMRRKLPATSKIMEGLATEDFVLIEQGAKELLILTEDAAFQVRRDPHYMHYKAAFEKNVESLREAAQRESLGDATIAYVNMTVSCVACHKDVRDVRQVAPAVNAFGDGPRRL